VKKLRRLGIADDVAANAFLETTYLPDHNARFAQRAASTDDFHRERRVGSRSIARSSSRRRAWCPTTG
jgi:hypothetical protein